MSTYKVEWCPPAGSKFNDPVYAHTFAHPQSHLISNFEKLSMQSHPSPSFSCAYGCRDCGLSNLNANGTRHLNSNVVSNSYTVQKEKERETEETALMRRFEGLRVAENTPLHSQTSHFQLNSNNQPQIQPHPYQAQHTTQPQILPSTDPTQFSYSWTSSSPQSQSQAQQHTFASPSPFAPQQVYTNQFELTSMEKLYLEGLKARQEERSCGMDVEMESGMIQRAEYNNTNAIESRNERYYL
ncbi:hypothetical protein BKA69DRAFT_1040592 [Paraphysoderma sedebokerense]|nr:hypothetical protein BKA69DRAFT_1040592 [Paraphysoderma sedebokerense]